MRLARADPVAAGDNFPRPTPAQDCRAASFVRDCPVLWKQNWAEAREHHARWWRHDGLVIVPSIPDAADFHRVRRDPHAVDPGPPATAEIRHADPDYTSAASHHWLATHERGLDALPIGRVDLGPGSLALYLGSEPEFFDETVWFHPAADPRLLERPLRLDPANRWWQRQLALIDAALRRSAGRYPIGCPDLVENLDVLASLCGAQRLLVDLLERPAWVRRKLGEIAAAYREVYDAIYARLALPDGSAAFWAFQLWGPGRTAKVQCDAAAMISPAMFDEFVAPTLAAQCNWLDCAMFHLDGTQAIPHLGTLLAIPGLDAIEYTPQAGVETGGHPRWWPLYRRILAAGKSVQIVAVHPAEVAPLLHALGPRGVYLHVEGVDSPATRRELEKTARRFYPR